MKLVAYNNTVKSPKNLGLRGEKKKFPTRNVWSMTRGSELPREPEKVDTLKSVVQLGDRRANKCAAPPRLPRPMPAHPGQSSSPTYPVV